MRSIGIHAQIERDLPTNLRGFQMDLYKLNVYDQLDACLLSSRRYTFSWKERFLQLYKDTPRGNKMFGLLVVVLPAQHEGGALVLRNSGTEWTVGLGREFATSDKPSIGYVAFFSGAEHEGLRAGRQYSHPFHAISPESQKRPLNNEETLPNGGYLGFGLRHEYVYDASQSLRTLLDKLKGGQTMSSLKCARSLAFSST
ncbi:hypothetical protein F5I97DRAFT_1925259 [Phlebopus sp. FC_14]|nr:hypothetical protein F5I97DRAFT_1925259 [Phlebopus sp. FC_14]